MSTEEQLCTLVQTTEKSIFKKPSPNPTASEYQPHALNAQRSYNEETSTNGHTPTAGLVDQDAGLHQCNLASDSVKSRSGTSSP